MTLTTGLAHFGPRGLLRALPSSKPQRKCAADGANVYPRLKPLRRAMALALLCLTGGLFVGVPQLDALEIVEEPGIEQQHDASRCGYRHDHNLCVIFQQTPAQATLASPLRPLTAPELRGPISQVGFISMAERFSTQAARAPPVLL